MASLGHIAIGLTAARVARTWGPPSGGPKWLPSALLWSALSFLPDADVIGFAFGVRYQDEWGHRGATHSLAFSIMLGAAIGLLAPRFRLPAWRTGVTATLVLASHAILDTFTDGGLGIALFWPFDLTRYFAPWRPIPVSPIGLAFFSPYGMFVAASEALIFAPLWWFALSRERTAWEPPAASMWGPPSLARRSGQTAKAAGGPKRLALPLALAAWALLLWLFTSTDPVRERVVAAVLPDDTEYSAGFSEERLNQVERGQTEDDVRARLGEPFNVFETPIGVCWVYSRPRQADGRSFRARGVCFIDGKVDGIVRRWIRD